MIERRCIGTQTALANGLGVHPGTISKWLSKTDGWPIDNTSLERLCEVLMVTREYLLFGHLYDPDDPVIHALERLRAQVQAENNQLAEACLQMLLGDRLAQCKSPTSSIDDQRDLKAEAASCYRIAATLFRRINGPACLFASQLDDRIMNLERSE